VALAAAGAPADTPGATLPTTAAVAAPPVPTIMTAVPTIMTAVPTAAVATVMTPSTAMAATVPTAAVAPTMPAAMATTVPTTMATPVPTAPAIPAAISAFRGQRDTLLPEREVGQEGHDRDDHYTQQHPLQHASHRSLRCLRRRDVIPSRGYCMCCSTRPRVPANTKPGTERSPFLRQPGCLGKTRGVPSPPHDGFGVSGRGTTAI